MNPIQEPKPKKRKKPFNAKKRAMDDLKAMGFCAWDVESRIPHTFITRDCFGFADILAHRAGVGILLIQVTNGGNHGNHRTKIFGEEIAPRVAAWLKSGGRVELWSYGQNRAKGAALDDALRREEITLADLPAIPYSDLTRPTITSIIPPCQTPNHANGDARRRQLTRL